RRDPLAELVVAVDDCRGVVGVNRDPGIELIAVRLRGALGCARELAGVLRECRGRNREADDERAAGFQKLAPRKSLRSEVAHRPPPAIARPARLMAFIRRGYVPHRQMWPFIAVRISASVGLGFFESSSAALIIWPL